MEEDEVIDILDPVTLFCVSFITINTSAIGMERFVAAWNCHSISGTINVLTYFTTLLFNMHIQAKEFQMFLPRIYHTSL